MDGSDINAIDIDRSRTFIVAGDDCGTVAIYTFPARKRTYPCIRLGGHSQHVSKVRIYHAYENEEAQRIISAGGYDRCYIQWKPGKLIEDEKK